MFQFSDICIITVVTTLVWTIYALLCRYAQFRRMKASIPGPDCGFWLGQTRKLLLQEEPFMEPQKRWVKEHYDESVIRYSGLLGSTSLMVMDPKLIKEILTSPSSKDDCRFYKPIVFFPLVVGYGLISTEGKTWMRHRRLIQPAFSLKFVRAAIEACVPQKVTSFLQHWIEASKHGVEIDVTSHMAALTLDIIGEAGFSYNCNGVNDVQRWVKGVKEGRSTDNPTLTDPLLTAFNQLMKPNLLRVVLALTGLGKLDQYVNPDTVKARSLLRKTADDILATNAAANDNDNAAPKSMLQVLMDATATDSSLAPFTDTELRDNIKTFLMSGHETATTLTYWALYVLAKYPQVQQALYENVLKHAPHKDTTINLEQLEQMDYLDAFLQEVLRMFPPIAYLERNNRFDEPSFGGYKVPKDTQLVMPTLLLHRHPKYWDQPNTFLPERWMNGKIPPMKNKFAYLPFGAGGHNCIGYKFATLEVKMIVAHLVRTVQVDMAPSQRNVDHSFVGFIGIVLRSNPALKIVVQPRS